MSRREIRRSTAQMLEGPPIVPISQLERSILKIGAHYASHRAIEYMAKLAKGSSAGTIGVLSPKGNFFGEGRKISKRKLKSLLTDAKKFSNTEVVEREGYLTTRGTLGYYGMRGASEYRMNVRGIIQERLSKSGRPLRLLDVGSADARMLSEMKDVFGNKIETHSLGPDDFPRFTVDFHHYRMGELLPKSFKGKFDLVFSNRAIEYGVLPNLSVRNIAYSLAPGGQAYLHYQPGRTSATSDPVARDALTRLLSTYSKGKATKGTFALMRRLSKEKGLDVPTLEKWIKDVSTGMKQHPLDTIQVIAFINELAALSRSKQLKVSISSFTSSPIGWVPDFIVIERTS
jgi:SAM-dependent methyltransferase